jgi:hypothetical protein
MAAPGWDAMQDFKVLKSNVYRQALFEGSRSAGHKLKAQAGAAQAKRDMPSRWELQCASPLRTALNHIVEGRSYKAFERDMGACAHISGTYTGTISHSEQQQQQQAGSSSSGGSASSSADAPIARRGGARTS